MVHCRWIRSTACEGYKYVQRLSSTEASVFGNRYWLHANVSKLDACSQHSYTLFCDLMLRSFSVFLYYTLFDIFGMLILSCGSMINARYIQLLPYSEMYWNYTRQPGIFSFTRIREKLKTPKSHVKIRLNGWDKIRMSRIHSFATGSTGGIFSSDTEILE